MVLERVVIKKDLPVPLIPLTNMVIDCHLAGTDIIVCNPGCIILWYAKGFSGKISLRTPAGALTLAGTTRPPCITPCLP